MYLERIKGMVEFIGEDEIQVVADNGKMYSIEIEGLEEKSIQKLTKLAEMDKDGYVFNELQVMIQGYAYDPLINGSFEEYSDNLPASLGINELEELKKLFYKRQELLSERRWNEAEDIFENMCAITDHHYLQQLGIPPFMEEFKNLSSLLSDDEIARLEYLYYEAMKLAKEAKKSEADLKWEEFFEIIHKYDNYSIPEFVSFEDFVKDYSLDEEEIECVKILYENAVELEKNEMAQLNEQDRWKYVQSDELQSAWHDIYSILTPFLKAVSIEICSMENKG